MICTIASIFRGFHLHMQCFLSDEEYWIKKSFLSTGAHILHHSINLWEAPHPPQLNMEPTQAMWEIHTRPVIS